MKNGEPEGNFRNIFILDSRDWFVECRNQYDPGCDLVLTYDLALKREIENVGGKVYYVDHLVDRYVMHENNFRVHEFLRRWHFDSQDKEIFIYEGIPFGFSFRLEIWNDLVFYVRARLCLEELRKLSFERVFAGTELELVEVILSEMKIDFSLVNRNSASHLAKYYFPAHKWITDNLRGRGLLIRTLTSATWVLSTILSWADRTVWPNSRKPTIYVHLYHPTQQLIRRLKEDGKVNVLEGTISRSLFRGPKGWLRSRFIPLRGKVERYADVAATLMGRFRANKSARLVLSNGCDISESVYALIDRKISFRIAETIRNLHCVIRHLDKNPVDMQVSVSNLGEVHMLVEAVCKRRDIPSFLIINGWLSGDFHDESKYATTINAYSTSIKEHYFRGLTNVVCLGDPRMDAYPPSMATRVVNRERFTVTIGVGTHSPMDLNSYVALEFEFMWDVLQSLKFWRKRGAQMRVVVKLRPTSYPDQYHDFVNEYFPGIVDEFLDNVSMRDALEKTDLYISHFSQTHFEASCLGIPCIYYKNDKEVLDPPFDAKSELVTVGSVNDLVAAISDFCSGAGRFDAFLQRNVMEKYIGPLDGGNVARNLKFVYDMLNKEIANRDLRTLAAGKR